MSSPQANNEVVVSFINKDTKQPMTVVLTDAAEWAMSTEGGALAQQPSGNYGPSTGAAALSPSAYLGVVMAGKTGGVKLSHKNSEVGEAALSVMTRSVTHSVLDFFGLGHWADLIEHLEDCIEIAEPNTVSIKHNGRDWMKMGINLDPRSLYCACEAFLPATPFYRKRGKSDLEWNLMKPSDRMGLSRR